MSYEGQTVDRILDEAQHLIQTRGYNKFSYADIAKVLEIRKPSIHYYFPSKSDLGRQVLVRYRRNIRDRLDDVFVRNPTLHQRISSYVRLYLELIDEDYLMCPGAMLATESFSLPQDIKAEVQGFFADQEQWLHRVLVAGKESGELRVTADEQGLVRIARCLVAGLEGALMVARLYADEDRFRSVADELLQQVGFVDETSHLPFPSVVSAGELGT